MQPSLPPTMKKSFLKNDRALVCSMLIFYGVCILGLVGATLWGLNRRSTRISSAATSTALASATQQANATRTAMAHATAQAQYEIIDPFDHNNRYWLTEKINDEYLNGSISVSTGLYVWNVYQIKQPFVYWANVRGINQVDDFDMYVDSKVVDGVPENICTGLVFRSASSDWEEGAYIFSVCNSSYFEVNYYEEREWESLSEWIYTSAIHKNDWNRLEVSARGDHFNFTINHENVFELTDERIQAGGLALLVEVEGEEPTTIWFDNFGLQRR